MSQVECGDSGDRFRFVEALRCQCGDLGAMESFSRCIRSSKSTGGVQLVEVVDSETTGFEASDLKYRNGCMNHINT